VGLVRRGIGPQTIAVIRRAHRLIYREHKKLSQARELLLAEHEAGLPIELVRLFDFIERQQAGKQGRQGEVRRLQPFALETAPAARRVA